MNQWRIGLLVMIMSYCLVSQLEIPVSFSLPIERTAFNPESLEGDGIEMHNTGDLLKRIDASYKGLDDYRCTLLSYNEDNDEERMVYFFKKPKRIRMELITPHKGTIVTYKSDDPFVYVSPFRWLRRLVLSFRLDNPLVMSSNGHQVDESDIGSFIDMILRPAVINGDASILDANPGSPDSYLINIDFKEETKGRPNKFKVWIDKRLLLPVRIDSYYPDGRLMESVTFKELTVNSGLSDDLFRLKR